MGGVDGPKGKRPYEGSVASARTLPSGDPSGKTIPDAVGDDAPWPHSGDLLGERYELQQELGRGAFGVVFRARDRMADEIVAIKVLALARAQSQEVIRRVRRELRAARKVLHPGVVRIHDLIGFEGRLALSMELIEGETLDRKLRAATRLEAAELQALAQDLARALAAAHKAGVVHRDLKPANIILRAATGRAVITDFGVSRLSEVAETAAAAPTRHADEAAPQLSREGDMLGTPLYMAPEQMLGRGDVGPAADVYALGVVLYEAATGTRPHAADNLAELLEAKLSRPAKPLAELRPDLPAPFCGLIDRCLAPEPAQRLASAVELRAMLLPPEASAVETPVAARRRAPLWIAIAVIAIVGSLGTLRLLRRSSGGDGSRRFHPSAPANAEATRLFEEGAAHLRREECVKAADLLERAVKADPRHPLSRSALAQALSCTGHVERARAEAKLAAGGAANLPREERLLVEARYHSVVGEPERAADVFRALFEFFPDDDEFGLELADAQLRADRPKEALQTAAALHALPPPQNTDPRIDLVVADADERLSDYKGAHEAAGRALERPAAQRPPLIEAQALHYRAWSGWKLGRFEEARADYQRARVIYEQAGDRSRASSTMNQLALVLRDRGDLAGARELLEQSMAIKRELGDLSSVAGSATNLGLILIEQGDLAGAERSFQEHLAAARQLGDQKSESEALTNVAMVLERKGDLAGSAKAIEQSLAIERQVGNRAAVGRGLTNLAGIQFEQGDLESARASYDSALAIRTEVGEKRGIAYVRYGLGDLALAQGDLAAARRHHEAALALRVELGNQNPLLESRVALAEVALEDGREAEAEQTLHELAERQGLPAATAARVHMLLARMLLERGRAADAAHASESARAAARDDPGLAEQITVLDARAAVALGKTTGATAIERLRAIEREATKMHRVGETLSIRLAMGRIELATGRQAEGRAHLLALAREARTRGYGLLARKASAPRNSR